MQLTKLIIFNHLLDEDAVLRRDGVVTADVDLVAVHLLLEAQDVLVFLLGAWVTDQARVFRQAPPTCGENQHTSCQKGFHVDQTEITKQHSIELKVKIN